MAADKEKKKFIEYAEQHPEYYPIMQSGLFIRVIKVLSEEAKNADDLSAALPKIEKKDLLEIIEMLFKVKLISKLERHGKPLYYANDNGLEFLRYCGLAKEKFGVA
jgi:hypothetical protein